MHHRSPLQHLLHNIMPSRGRAEPAPATDTDTDFVDTQPVDARAAAAQASAEIPILVAPTLPFGSSQHHIPFGGTLSLSTETYYHVLGELCESLVASGFRRFFILNGHGGNNELIQLVARDIALRYPAHLAAAAYWTIAWDALVAEQAHANAGLPGHAGTFETSLILALRPELVREPRPHRDAPAGVDPRGFQPYRAELHGAWQRIDGYTDSPAAGDGALGQAYLDVIAESVGQSFIAFYQRADAELL